MQGAAARLTVQKAFFAFIKAPQISFFSRRNTIRREPRKFITRVTGTVISFANNPVMPARRKSAIAP